MKKNLLLCSCLSLLLLASCSKDDSPAPSVAPAKGVYVLSEGMFFGNNAKLGFYSFNSNTIAGDFFVQQNPTIPAGIGGLATDMIIYGTKLYVVVDQSHKVTVLNAANATFVKDIAFVAGGSPVEPRYVTTANGKVFVSAWDGTVNVIDTTTLEITKKIPVGLNPEGLVVSGNNLYVSNSGGLTATFDSTVSVINLGSLTETSKIHVGKNPTSITADESGNIYIATQGNYASIPPRLVKVNTGTNTVIKSADTTVGALKYYNNALYVTGGYSGVQQVRKLSTTDFSAMSTNFVTDGTIILNPYSINIDEQNDDVYITDAKNNILTGELFCFNKTGKKKFSVATSPGVNPNKVVFVR